MADNNTLEFINSINFQANIPSFVLITLLLPFGVVTNLLTLFIFMWREVKCNLRIFLMFLTLADLSCCLFGVPLVMVDLLFPVMHPAAALCKMQRFVLHFCNIAGLFTLLVVAAERYNATCRSSARQLNLFQVKKITLAVIGVSLLLALPVALVSDTLKYHLVNGEYGHICWYRFPLQWDVYVWTIFAIFWASFLAIFTLYCLVWKSMNRSEPQSEESERIGSSTERDNKLRQTNKALLGVSVLCAVSLTPYIILNHVSWPKESPYVESWLTFKLFLIHLWIVNCTGKPVVYVIFDYGFRGHFKSIFWKEQQCENPENETTKDTEE